MFPDVAACQGFSLSNTILGGHKDGGHSTRLGLGSLRGQISSAENHEFAQGVVVLAGVSSERSFFSL